ncbi:MAG: dihydropteroate synthase [Muricomes sp.]
MRIGKRDFDTENHTYIMGILNVTPDSFSDGGKYNNIDMALKHAQEMIRDGADILDIGGESTRPGHTQITEEEEIQRVIPALERLRREFDVPISIDTYKSKVAREAILAGADLVNDIWGLKYDDRMAQVVSESKIPCCLMHNRKKAEYESFLSDVQKDLQVSIDIARNAGIEKDKIILDPGVGFGKTYEMNLEIIKELDKLKGLGYPVLLGTSRKGVIGLTLNLPSDQREEGTLVTTVLGMVRGCAFVRVHDVKGNKRAIQMTEAILREHEV